MRWKDLQCEKSYDKVKTQHFPIKLGKFNWLFLTPQYKAYGQSKLANILHGQGLAQRLNDDGISVYSLHPGILLVLYPIFFYIKNCFRLR